MREGEHLSDVPVLFLQTFPKHFKQLASFNIPTDSGGFCTHKFGRNWCQTQLNKKCVPQCYETLTVDGMMNNDFSITEAVMTMGVPTRLHLRAPTHAHVAVTWDYVSLWPSRWIISGLRPCQQTCLTTSPPLQLINLRSLIQSFPNCLKPHTPSTSFLPVCEAIDSSAFRTRCSIFFFKFKKGKIIMNNLLGKGPDRVDMWHVIDSEHKW